MNRNEGTTDRVIRIVAGLAVLVLGYFYQTWWGLIGIIPLLTGVVGWCGLYTVFDFSTKRNS